MQNMSALLLIAKPRSSRGNVYVTGFFSDGRLKLRAEQCKHFGGVPGRMAFTNIPQDYIIDVLHLILGIAPLLFRQTIQANVTAATMQKVAKLSMSAESWPGNVCREIMDWYP